MQIKNNYDIPWVRNKEHGTGIFNGDIGTVLRIDHADEKIQIELDDRCADYDFNMLDELEMAYAVTVHKSQGNEFTAIVIPMYQCHKNLMTRNLFYTAVTRAKKLVALVGREDVISYMTENNFEDLRYSDLTSLLIGE